MINEIFNLINNKEEEFNKLYQKTEIINIDFILENTYYSRINKSQLDILNLKSCKIKDIKEKEFTISKIDKLLFIKLKGKYIADQKKILNECFKINEAYLFYKKFYNKYSKNNVDFIPKFINKDLFKKIIDLKKNDSCFSKKLYLIHMNKTNYYKIGIASDLSSRLSTIQTGNPEKLIIINSIECRNICSLEDFLHSLFYKKRKNGEWFVFNDSEISIVLDIYKSLSDI